MLPSVALVAFGLTLGPAEDAYELVHLKCVTSGSNEPRVQQVVQTILNLEGKDNRLANQLRESKLFPLLTYQVESRFVVVKHLAGRGRCQEGEVRGQFESRWDERGQPLFTTNAKGLRRVCEPWLKADEEGYWWVRRGALVSPAVADEWGVVTGLQELNRLIPFPDLCGPFGGGDQVASRSHLVLPTRKECEQWADGVAVTLKEQDREKQRGHLLRYAGTDNEVLASWAVHRLTQLPADKTTVATVRGLLADAYTSPLTVITADRFLCRYEGETWPTSQERVEVLATTLQRTRLSTRQTDELVRFIKLQAWNEPQLTMPILAAAFKGPKEVDGKRLALFHGVGALDLLPPRGKGSPNGRESEAVRETTRKFYLSLMSDEYPSAVRERAEKRLKDPSFSD